MSAGLERIAWYGRGPAETYIDRAFERVGVYSSTVADQWVEYSRPQENGNKTDVRWVELTNARGHRPARRRRAAAERGGARTRPRTTSRQPATRCSCRAGPRSS